MPQTKYQTLAACRRFTCHAVEFPIKRWDATSIAMPLGAHSSQNYPVQHEATGSTLQLQCRTAQGKLQGSAELAHLAAMPTTAGSNATPLT